MRALKLACIVVAVMTIAYPFAGREPVPPEEAVADIPEGSVPEANVPEKDQQQVAALNVPVEDNYPDSMPLKPNLSYLAYYAYSEVPPDTKPADVVLNAVRDIPSGTPIDEIKLAAAVLGLDVSFMKIGRA